MTRAVWEDLRDALFEFMCCGVDLHRSLVEVHRQLESRKTVSDKKAFCRSNFKSPPDFEPLSGDTVKELDERLIGYWKAHTKVIHELNAFSGSVLDLLQGGVGNGWKVRVTRTIDLLSKFLQYTRPNPEHETPETSHSIILKVRLKSAPPPDWSEYLTELQSYVEQLHHLRTSAEVQKPLRLKSIIAYPYEFVARMVEPVEASQLISVLVPPLHNLQLFLLDRRPSDVDRDRFFDNLDALARNDCHVTLQTSKVMPEFVRVKKTAPYVNGTFYPSFHDAVKSLSRAMLIEFARVSGEVQGIPFNASGFESFRKLLEAKWPQVLSEVTWERVNCESLENGIREEALLLRMETIRGISPASNLEQVAVSQPQVAPASQDPLPESKHETRQDDNPKKFRKRIRSLDQDGTECIRRYSEGIRIGDPVPMKEVVKNYVFENPSLSSSSLMRMLNDHSEKWKNSFSNKLKKTTRRPKHDQS